MPKKNNSYNAFYFFMKDWQKNEERKGIVFPNGIRDVQNNHNCIEAWKSLSDKDKAKYKTIEKDHKIKLKICKKTTFGESVEVINQNEEEQNIFIDNMKEYIFSMLQEAKKNNSIEKLKFCVVHVNYSYSRLVDNEIEYYPAEISIAEFSLERGIIRTYNKIICSKVHIGYASAAIDHSRATHQISRDVGESNHAIVHNEICNFLDPNRINGKLPPLYTRYQIPDIKNPVINILNMFHNAYGNDNNHFVVYSFEELFVNLHNISKPEDSDIINLNPIIVTIKLKEDSFDYKKTLQYELNQIQQWHSIMNAGGNDCSKSYVQRWIFILCSYCCDFFEINLIPGCHIPQDGNDDNASQLNESFNSMSISKERVNASTGACENVIKHRSERSYEEEQQRRVSSLPIHIVFHNDEKRFPPQSKKNPIPDDKPLRLPFTRSAVFLCDDPSTCLDLDEDRFPSVGRGARPKEWGATNNTRKPDSHASHLK